MAGERFINVPTMSEIDQGFNDLTKAETKGVKGVMEFKSEQPGPKLYVGTLTHGDEKVGAGLVVPFLKGAGNGGIELTRGSVVLAANNLLGALNGKRALTGDLNFNRLPPDILDNPTAISDVAAVNRMRRLHNAGFLPEATHGFDAHTYVARGNSMKVHEKGDPNFADQIGISDYIVDIVKHQGGTLAFGNFIGGPDNEEVPVIEIEGGGPHDDPRIIQGLIHGLVATLYKLGMIDERFIEIAEGEQKKYPVVRYMDMPSGGYKFASDAGNFGAVKQGDTLAVDTSESARSPVVAPHDGNLVMPPPYDEVIPGGDDWWLSSPAEVTTQDFVRARLNIAA